MIFIFGYQPVNKNIGPVQEIECPNCHHKKHWMLRTVSYFVSLFFLPIFPLKRNYEKYCPVCGFSQSLTREEYHRHQDLALLNNEALDSDMGAEEYDKRLAKLQV